MDRAGLIALFLLFCGGAQAEVILSCTFPTLPSVVMRFPDGVGAEKQMSVASRPAVPLMEGQGSGRMISADVDGYHFRFAPQNSTMDVERDGALILSEAGSCVTIGGPTNETPLQINPPIVEAPATNGAQSEATQTDTNTPTDRGNWIVTEDKSAFDDSRTVVLSLYSNEPIRGQFGAPAPASLFLRCQENSTSLFLVLNDLFLADIQGFGSVDYRIDDTKADVVHLANSTDNKALGLWDGGSAIPFIKRLMAGKTVVFRATPFNESPVEFSFTLAGLDAAAIPLKEACRLEMTSRNLSLSLPARHQTEKL